MQEVWKNLNAKAAQSTSGQTKTQVQVGASCAFLLHQSRNPRFVQDDRVGSKLVWTADSFSPLLQRQPEKFVCSKGCQIKWERQQ
eukprot:1186539-Rhodomonas_salina.1